MQLIYSPASPFVRKVRVLLIETDQQNDVELVPVATSALKPAPEAIAANPLGKIPSLLCPDGTTLYDSRVICRYLAVRAEADLYPQNTLWESLTLEATADGILEAALLIVYEKRLRPTKLVFEDWLEAQWSKISCALNVLEDRWLTCLSGPNDIGQIAIACALGYLDFRHNERNWREERDGLACWYAAYSKRESMVLTTPSD
ncbi:glutathione S-transferase [Pseudopelagicola sp. nBUS_20]|uniref:glutathione S-transferase n=1 Tax=Pseudopelagicola sp. nBUS_20 TaxID=3395317 RepID=UPI003EBD0F65